MVPDVRSTRRILPVPPPYVAIYSLPLFVCFAGIRNWLFVALDAGLLHTCRRGDIRRHHEPFRNDLGHVFPGHILQRAGRAGLDALGLAVAETAFGRLFDLFVKGRHLPGTGLLADPASCALLRVDYPGIDWG